MKIVDLRDAWKKYQPMNPPPDEEAKKRILAGPWVSDKLDVSIDFSLQGLRKLLRENLSRQIEDITKSTEPGPGREQAVGLLLARSGLLEEARAVFEKAIFGEKGPPDIRSLHDAAEKVSQETAILLCDLSLCLSLGARSTADLDGAAAYTELALGGFPEGAQRERGEMMLRLALFHRLRGDLPAERRWSAQAFSLEPSLKETYEGLVRAGGPVAGPSDELVRYLRSGLR